MIINKTEDREPAARWLRFFARVITGLWAGFWIFFAVSSAAQEIDTGISGYGLDILTAVSFTVIILLLALTAWRWERIGRIALPLAGLAVLAVCPTGLSRNFTITTIAFVMATLGLPPLSAGILLIAANRIDCRGDLPRPAGN